MRKIRKSWKGIDMETKDGGVVHPSRITLYCGCCGCCCFAPLIGCR